MKSYSQAFIDRFGAVIKQHGPQLTFLCPTCGHKSLSANIQSGLYKCWSCGLSPKNGGRIEGSADEYRELPVDRDLQHSMVRWMVGRWPLSNGHQEYLRKRGIFNPDKYKLATIPFDAVEQLVREFPGVDYESSGLINRDFETSKLRPALCMEPRRIMVPFWNGSSVITFKSRENPFEYNDWDGWKYMSPRGSKVGSNLFYRTTFHSTDLLITEGELKAISALEAWFWTTAIPGIEFSKPALDQLLGLISRSKVKRAFIVLDNEPNIETHYPVLRSMARLSSYLGKKAAIVALPRNSSDKMDLDTFLSTHNGNDLEDVLEDSWYRRKQTAEWVNDRIKALSQRT